MPTQCTVSSWRARHPEFAEELKRAQFKRLADFDEKWLESMVFLWKNMDDDKISRNIKTYINSLLMYRDRLAEGVERESDKGKVGLLDMLVKAKSYIVAVFMFMLS